MDEITLDDKTYVSSKRAAQITGYAKDYVGQLCREGRVQARLVGRNWYVLESSIREHRFGAPAKESEAESTNEAENKTWTPSNYSADPAPELLPTLNVNVFEGRTEQIEPAEAEIPVTDSHVVREMQSAWHDWFAQSNQREVSNEILLEEQVEMPLEDTTVPSEEFEEQFDTESTPINIEKVVEQIEIEPEVFEEEEVVPVHRSYTRSAPIYESIPRSISHAPIAPRTIEQRTEQYPVPEGRIIRERRVIRKIEKKPSGLLTTLFIVVALVAIAVAVIGSGVADPIVSKISAKFTPVQYLVGESSFEKVNQ